VKVLVTGANGFVGSRLVPRLLDEGHRVTAAVGPGGHDCSWLLGAEAVPTLDLSSDESVLALAQLGAEWVVHVAGFSSGADSLKESMTAYAVNTMGTARLAEAVGREAQEGQPVRFLFASSGLVYGNTGLEPASETSPTVPHGPYAGSKAAAEVALAEIGERTGLEVIVSRSFAHTGAAQDSRFVVPAFARRISDAARSGVKEIPVGNLIPRRDFLHVDDVVDAYVQLLSNGTAGATYNVASGVGVSIGELFQMIAEVVGANVEPETESSLVREGEALHSVGDGSKLRSETGWRPKRTLRETVQEVVDAQTN
jgi:GDP-4-dehydro-6-deoxy-D-mannose reductase